MPGHKASQMEPGAPVQPGFIPLSVPEIRGNAWKYVKECLDTNWVSSVGPFVDRFERVVADYVGAQHAVATVNGTAALHTALLVAGVQPDEEVLVSTLTFVASANAVRYAGAWPVFIDSDPVYWQIDPEAVVHFTERDCLWKGGRLINRETRRRVRAVLPVHILGHPCNMDPILEVARKYNLVVVEDAAESIGAMYKGRKVGGLGDIGCFSFNGNKLITTGGGGMIVTNNPDWAQRAKYLTTQAKDDPVEYCHREIGYNYRLTNLQAALGCAQMEQISDFISVKRRITSAYAAGLQAIAGISGMQEAPWASSVSWLYTVLVDALAFGMGSRQLLKHLGECGIQARPLWEPLHQSAAHRQSQRRECLVADRLSRGALSLPSSVGLTDVDQRSVVEAIARIHREVMGPYSAR